MGKSVNPQYDEAEARALRIIDEWEAKLGLKYLGLEVRHRFIRDHYEPDHDRIADTESVWHYRYATTSWYLPSITRLSDEDLVETVVHELLHALLSPMESKVPEKHSDLCEFAIETTARALIHLDRSKS